MLLKHCRRTYWFLFNPISTEADSYSWSVTKFFKCFFNWQHCAVSFSCLIGFRCLVDALPCFLCNARAAACAQTVLENLEQKAQQGGIWNPNSRLGTESCPVLRAFCTKNIEKQTTIVSEVKHADAHPLFPLHCSSVCFALKYALWVRWVLLRTALPQSRTNWQTCTLALLYQAQNCPVKLSFNSNLDQV